MPKKNRNRRPSFSRRNVPSDGLLESLLGGSLGIGLMAKIFISAMLADVRENLLGKVRAVLPLEPETVDQGYVDRLAVSVYMCAITVPYHIMLETAGSVVNYAWNIMLQEPDGVSLDKLYEIFQKGFGEISPSMAAACTREVIQQVGHLLLNDWLNHDGSPDDAQTLQLDIHFYYDEVLELEGAPDKTQVKLESHQHIMNMPPEELAGYDPELIERVKAWKPEGESGE